jgi:hypothetical protein
MFFYIEQINQEIYDNYAVHLIEASDEELTDSEDEENNKGVLATLNKELERDYQKNWGNLALAKNVAKEFNESFFFVLHKPATEVLTLAMMLKDEVHLIESKMKK